MKFPGDKANLLDWDSIPFNVSLNFYLLLMNPSGPASGFSALTGDSPPPGAAFCAEVLLPIPLEKSFTYLIPPPMVIALRIGHGVLVPFGAQKTMTGIVTGIQPAPKETGKLKEILALMDHPPLDPLILSCWDWMAGYYLCTRGEVMKAALTAGFSPAPVSPKSTETWVSLSPSFQPEGIPENLRIALKKKAPAQERILRRFLEISHSAGHAAKILKTELIRDPSKDTPPFKALIKKGLFRMEEKPSTRNLPESSPVHTLPILSKAQQSAMDAIREGWKKIQTILLQGVTSSGKTEIYIHLIAETLQNQQQVLFLLPEIPAISQIGNRLREVFGHRVRIYHSRQSPLERKKLWCHLNESKEPSVVLGTRSALFLPFSTLGLILVDEEHEASYKQADPAPRYHARDSAIMFGSLLGARILLGSATPSIETLYNVKTGKYGLALLQERFSQKDLPEVRALDVLNARKQGWMKHPFFHPEAIRAIAERLENKEQVLVFHNRRGFASYLECMHCGDIPRCPRCDVSLTWHRQSGRLVCHYCGHRVSFTGHCLSCGQTSLKTTGSGTEKIEEELGLLFPRASILRIDTDSFHSGAQWDQQIKAIESGLPDILVGTQMISKGFDFGNLTLTVIQNADQMLYYPDFRSYEKTFQLLLQTGGRTGRRDRQGLVLIQTRDPLHPILQAACRYDQEGLLMQELKERHTYGYPPYTRLIRISVRHVAREACQRAAEILASHLRVFLQESVLGPEAPPMEKLRGLYCQEILIKLNPRKAFPSIKQQIRECLASFLGSPDSKGIRIIPDVDPL